PRPCKAPCLYSPEKGWTKCAIQSGHYSPSLWVCNWWERSRRGRKIVAVRPVAKQKNREQKAAFWPPPTPCVSSRVGQLEDESDTSVEPFEEPISVSGEPGIERGKVEIDRVRRRNRLEEVQEIVTDLNLHTFNRVPPHVDDRVKLRHDRVVFLTSL